MPGAKKKANKAKSLLSVHKKRATQNLSKYIIIAEQELVEVLSFLAIVEKKQIPSLSALKVSNESYVLGLLDCIGELKRLVYDNIRNRKSKEAERIFKIMENLYLNLYPFAIYDKLIHEVRRKLDVNRILVEDARTAITEESRRMELINKLDNN
jgi:translin